VYLLNAAYFVSYFENKYLFVHSIIKYNFFFCISGWTDRESVGLYWTLQNKKVSRHVIPTLKCLPLRNELWAGSQRELSALFPRLPLARDTSVSLAPPHHQHCYIVTNLAAIKTCTVSVTPNVVVEWSVQLRFRSPPQHQVTPTTFFVSFHFHSRQNSTTPLPTPPPQLSHERFLSHPFQFTN
jgi:hypothetical protein